MRGKIPPDAFQYYLGRGAERSYQKVADHYGASKRAVTKVATAAPVLRRQSLQWQWATKSGLPENAKRTAPQRQ